MPFVTHANVASGFHASNPSVMSRTVRDAAKAGIQVGAHPGIADRVRRLEFDDPDANDWLAVNQFTVVEGQHNRRPDVVVFVNGRTRSRSDLRRRLVKARNRTRPRRGRAEARATHVPIPLDPLSRQHRP